MYIFFKQKLVLVKILTNTGLYTVKTNKIFDFRPNFTLHSICRPNYVCRTLISLLCNPQRWDNCAIGAYNLAGRARGDHNRTQSIEEIELQPSYAASIIVGSIGIKWVAKFQIQVVHNPNFIVMQMLCKSSIISWNVPLLRLPLLFPRITNTVRIISLPNKLSPLKQIGLNLTSLE